MIANAILVPLATAFVFFLQYRIYFSQWHAHALSETWFWQIGFTGATAVYLFIVSGVHYIFPYGIVVLIGVSALFCKWSGGGPGDNVSGKNSRDVCAQRVDPGRIPR
jgi:hypothetical protein